VKENTPTLRRYDHEKEPGAYGVCRRCGREHSTKFDADELARAVLAKHKHTGEIG
jgi:hypothetical protein